MSEAPRITCTYRILRYVPDLRRDEWINIGIVFHDRSRDHIAVRTLDPEDFPRLRRVHPEANLDLLRSLLPEIERQIQLLGEQRESPLSPEERIGKLDDSLSNLIQCAPQKAVLTPDPAAELERLFAQQVTPPRPRPRSAEELETTRAGLRARATEIFRRAGLLPRMETRFPVESFTFPGDTMRVDFAYRQNGTRGFVHATPLLRDQHAAKEFSFTAERIRSRVPGALFHALTEPDDRRSHDRYAALAGFLREQKIEVVPLSELPDFAGRLRALIQ